MFADGGTFATKPYIGGANYIRKMSNYPKGDWEEIWNGLFWRFVSKHDAFFRSNPRTSMLFYSLNKMSDDKREAHMQNAELFIAKQLDMH
jgi:deoxyribodipyrimidine photolyase-related protein